VLEVPVGHLSELFRVKIEAWISFLESINVPSISNITIFCIISSFHKFRIKPNDPILLTSRALTFIF